MKKTTSRPTRVRRIRTVGCAISIAAGTAVALTNSPLQAAGQNSCLAGNVCVAYQAQGSITYGFVSQSLNNINGFTYSNGVSVGNDVGFGRMRNSNFVRACFRNGIDQMGQTLFSAPYSGATWVQDGTATWGTESYAVTNGAC